MKLKDDKFRKVRGGRAKVIAICCANCHETVIHYQKDGIGGLHRCYVNRVIAPESFTKLVSAIAQERDLPVLKCEKCQNIVGYPTTHTDKRLAWNLILGKWEKKSL
jgi:hypothetical protein